MVLDDLIYYVFNFKYEEYNFYFYDKYYYY